MTTVNATALRNNLFDYLALAVTSGDTINVTTKNGNAIILSEEEYQGLQETLYLLSIPGMKDRLAEGLQATLDDTVAFEW
ncbi:MAG: type II toxin-antitoxin system Phd/YefM family antitoxin [Coriobacteriia bacterium]|nr:type II toxin-antitoxin system Phd/YefM family antitoxin [Coriobacteriia bacterium]